MAQLLDFERETIIQFDDGSDTASIYTANIAVAKRLEKYGLKAVKVQGEGYFFEVPKQAIKLKLRKRNTCHIAGQFKSDGKGVFKGTRKPQDTNILPTQDIVAESHF